MTDQLGSCLLTHRHEDHGDQLRGSEEKRGAHVPALTRVNSDCLKDALPDSGAPLINWSNVRFDESVTNRMDDLLETLKKRQQSLVVVAKLLPLSAQ